MNERTNPRAQLRGNHFERLFEILDLAEEKGDSVGELLTLLGNSFPTGNHRDSLGATASQLTYISTLARLDDEEHDDFVLTILEGGGISSGEANHLIRRLKDSTR